MRISTDPTDPAYIDDRPRKAWCNDVAIEGWHTADEFRRVVITPERVHNGAVLIERLRDESAAPEPADAPLANAGLGGMFEHVHDPKPSVAEPATVTPAPKAKHAAPRVKRRR